MTAKTLEEYVKALSERDAQVGGSHYKAMGVQPVDIVATWPIEQQVDARP